MSTVYKTIIVDDERPVRVFTRHVLQQYAPLFDLVAEADSGRSAIEQINRLKPDLVFLDIRMPDMDGFAVLEHLQHKPMIIFLTAYDHYAVRAFEANGIDYLQKPLLAERLEHAIRKLEHRYPLWLAEKAGMDYRQFQDLIHKIAAPKMLHTSITVKVGNKMVLLPLDDIVALQSKEKYTSLQTKDGREYLENRSLTELQTLLPGHFLRIQKGAIINTKCILEIRKHFNNRFYFHMNGKAAIIILSGHTYAAVIREALQF